MNKVDLDKQREAVIEEIKRVFPVSKPPKALVKDRNEYHSKALLELFEDKTWVELVNQFDITWAMSDIDYIQAMNEKAYRYYLPAFLITTLSQSYGFESPNALIEMKFIARELDIDKLQVLISYFTYQERYWRDLSLDILFIQKLEDILLQLLILLDEKKPKV